MSETPLGRICWYECLTTDLDAAQDFYPPVTGWGRMKWEGGDPQGVTFALHQVVSD